MVYSSTTRASELSPSRVFVAADVDYSQQRKQTNPMKATITPTVGSLTRHDAVTSPCLSTGVEATLLLGRKQPQLEYCDASTSPNMTTANKEAPNMTTTNKEASLALLLLNQNNHSNEERRAVQHQMLILNRFASVIFGGVQPKTSTTSSALSDTFSLSRWFHWFSW